MTAVEDTPPIWTLTVEEATERFGGSVEGLKALSLKAYLLSDEKRSERGFHGLWRAWERGTRNMPLCVQAALEEPQNIAIAWETLRGDPAKAARMAQGIPEPTEEAPMAKAEVTTFEGVITAEVAIRVKELHANWRILGEVEFPYRVELTLTNPPQAATGQDSGGTE